MKAKERDTRTVRYCTSCGHRFRSRHKRRYKMCRLCRGGVAIWEPGAPTFGGFTLM